MELQLINSEDLSESRLYRFTDGFRRLSARDIADIFYLETLSVLMFMQDDEQRDYAVAYAEKTSQYGPYAVYRTAATDLYLLGFAIKNPEYNSLRFSGSTVKFLKKLNFDNRKHYMMMNRVARSYPSKSDISQFLIRLESQLSISNSMYKQIRRLIVDWPDLKYSQKQYVVAKILQSIRAMKAPGSEIFNHLVAMKRTRAYKDVPPAEKRSAVKTAAAVAAGGYLGSKILPKVTKGKIKSTTGAGIGAIAGYWASGRKKQS